MAGLYLQAISDKKKPFTKTAKTRFNFKVEWGDKSEPKPAADIEVSWPKNQLLPKVVVKHPSLIKVEEVTF